jgi:hypothetical protein
MHTDYMSMMLKESMHMLCTGNTTCSMLSDGLCASRDFVFSRMDRATLLCPGIYVPDGLVRPTTYQIQP